VSATQQDVTGKLSAVPLFSGCSKREVGLIAKAAKHVNHKEDTVLAREGDRGVGLFLILDGEAKVTIGGKQKAVLKPGDFFGEIALLDGGPRTATVTAVSPMKCVVLSRGQFHNVIRQNALIAVSVLETLGERLRTLLVGQPT